ncbi:lysozyme g-like [Spea bombifrons]|uniref:lysozyme g-like n=1 Tax=Spea bombifrons TaxID=233779 RepID=UPI00234A500A|nr:lysozyme g-like [Spea bombifrons]
MSRPALHSGKSDSTVLQGPFFPAFFDRKMCCSALLVFLGVIGSVSASGKYGDINLIPTTGASCSTSSQDSLAYCGVRASERMAQTDIQRVNNLKDKIKSVANKKGMDPAVIAGIISRESRGGSVLKNGWGDGGNAWGVMQVDKRYHKILGAWNSEEHISQGTDILIGMFNSIKNKFPNWTIHQHLKGAIAAYNTGSGRVSSFSGVDDSTTGKDYSNDVVARARFYRQNGYY